MRATHRRSPRIRAALCVVAALVAAAARAAGPAIPLQPGTTFVLAVSNTGPGAISPVPGQPVAQGDYETVVTITAADPRGIAQTAFIDADDEKGVRRQASVRRLVRAEDLAAARLQVIGFHSLDPEVLDGATALGPSLAVVRELSAGARAAYSFRNFAGRDAASGVLTRDAARVSFPVLLNGQRVLLDAIRATGQMATAAATRPFEQIILDDPRHPVSLRIAYGPRGGGFPFKPDFARDVVRIDFASAEPSALDAALAKDCRAEVPGLYFDFDRATLKPQSAPALREMARAIAKQPGGPVGIEGHTDDIGGERYNDELSRRRADAVKAALVAEHGVAASSLRAAGFGARRPREPNDTLAGRARNRRVELVLACAAAPRRP
jgi:outer membrane protein OmpA-like peptidoglycan-associated protein